MTNIPFCALGKLSLVCLLKSNFWSRCKHKCFWETLRSTGTSLKKTLGWKSFTVFREKNNFLSSFGKIMVEYHSPLMCPFGDSLQVIIGPYIFRKAFDFDLLPKNVLNQSHYRVFYTSALKKQLNYELNYYYLGTTEFLQPTN